MTATPERLRVEVRLLRYPCPALFDYLTAVPLAQRATVLRHLIYLGWLAQSGPPPAAGPPLPPVEPLAPAARESPPPDPLELELLQSLAE